MTTRFKPFNAPRVRMNVHSRQGPPQGVGGCEEPQPGRFNVAVGWTGIALGLMAALWIGMWAFAGPMPAPAGFEAYDALPRRLLRLAHIAAVMVGVLNVVLGRDLARLKLPAGWKRITSVLGIVAWPGLVAPLAVAAFVPAAKFALPVGALSLTAAMGIAAVGAWRAAWGGKANV